MLIISIFAVIMVGITDEKLLVKEFSRGSHTAFRELFVRYYPKVRFFILGLIKSEDEAEDLRQG